MEQQRSGFVTIASILSSSYLSLKESWFGEGLEPLQEKTIMVRFAAFVRAGKA